MSKTLTLGIGLLLIVVAFLLASGTNGQDVIPDQARAFSTALHITPTRVLTPTPYPTQTLLPAPLPTITPIPGWIRFRASGVELWLPRDYNGYVVDVPSDVQRSENTSMLDEGLIVYDTPDTGPWDLSLHSGPVRTVRIARLKVAADPELFPYTIVGLGFYDFRLERPRRVYMGRYGPAYTTVATGPATDGRVLSKLLYWIEYGGVYWLVIYESPASEYDRRMPVFSQSILTFTILP